MKQNTTPLVKGFKYCIYPTKDQQIQLAKLFGCCRFVYNRLLDETIAEYEAFKLDSRNVKPSVSAFDLMLKLPVLKRQEDTLWLAEPAAQVLQATCANLASAYKRFFKEKKGFPKFKSKHDKQSATFPNQSFSTNGKTLKLAKFKDPIKVKWHRELPMLKQSELTITKTPSGKYYVSIIAEYLPVKTSGVGVIGIDAGITDLVTFSDGTSLVNPRHYVKAQQKLKRAQQSLSRKQKGSKNRTKQRVKVAKIHEHIAQQRSHYLHNLTTKIIRENQAIGIERLTVTNMVKNRHLAKHIADAGWGEFRRQLEYKTIASQHCTLVEANPYFPSTQVCNCCGHKPKQKLKLSTRSWLCEYCGSVHQRDHNAAINLENLATMICNRERQLGVIEGKIILSENYHQTLFLDYLKHTPKSSRCQPMESSCAVRHLNEVGSLKLKH